MTNDTQVFLHEAGSDYRRAVAVYAEIEKFFDTDGTTLSAISREALVAKVRTDHAFYEMAETSQTVLALTMSIAAYDSAHEKALQERNSAGDALDYAALIEDSSPYRGPEALEQCAKRFALAQTAHDELQAKCRRKYNVIALRRAEANYAEKVKIHDQFKLASDALKAAAAEQENEWNRHRVELLQQLAVVERYRTNLRSAARAYAAVSPAPQTV
jgi:hypothetical protein